MIVALDLVFARLGRGAGGSLVGRVRFLRRGELRGMILDQADSDSEHYLFVILNGSFSLFADAVEY